jgi:thioredoxin reductase (NADPH)
MSTHITDIAIIGAGPVGLFAIFECGMLRMKCHVIDALDEVGGQCAALYPEKPIYDIPGYPAINAINLVHKLETQAAPFAPVYHLGQRVEKLERVGEAWRLITSKGVVIEAKAVIIAAGCGAFGPNRPPLEGIEAYEGKSVHYLVKRKEDFRGKKVVIAGGGDSAVDWALSFADVAEKLYMVHRRPKFRAAPESVSRMEALAAEGKIQMVIPYQLSKLTGQGSELHAVHVETLDGEELVLPADHLLAFFGLAMELGPIAEWGLNLHMNHIEVNPATLQTSAPGIYAIGDIATYEKKLKLILCGFSEAAMAAHDARNLVYPGEAYHFEYSTSKGVQAA